MRIHPSAYLSLFAFAPMAALAEGATATDPATTPAAAATTEEKKVTYELEVGTRLFLSDSTNKKTPYFETYYVPVWGAMYYSHGYARAGLEAEVGPSTDGDASTLRIRQGYGGVETPYGTEIRGGRFTPEYIKKYNPFVLSGMGDKIGLLDGVLVGQNVELGGNDKAFVQLFMANGLPVGSIKGNSTPVAAVDTTYLKSPQSGQRAYGLALGGDMMGLSARFTWAMNPSKVLKVTEKDGETQSLDLTGDYSRYAFSLGYSMTGISAGGYMEGLMIGSTKAIKQPSANGKVDTTGEKLSGNATWYRWGIGVKGTSELFGVTGIMGSGDVITYGVGYEAETVKFDNLNGNKMSDKDIKSEGNFGISVGYQVSGFTAAIGFKATNGAKTKDGTKLLNDADGKKKDSSNSVQMAFLYNL